MASFGPCCQPSPHRFCMLQLMLATAMPMKQHDFTECRLYFYWKLLEPYVSAGQIHLVLMMFLHWCLSGSCWSLFHDAFSLQPWLSQPPSAWISLHPSFIPKTSSQTYPKGLGKAKEPWKCFMAQYVLPFIKTPFFVVNSFYDSWQFHDRKGKLCCNIVVRWYVALVIWLSDSACICIYLLKDGLTQLLNGLCWW